MPSFAFGIPTAAYRESVSSIALGVAIVELHALA